LDVEQIATEIQQASEMGQAFFEFCGIVESWNESSWKWSLEERKKMVDLISEKKR
jgi:hypothetical protein